MKSLRLPVVLLLAACTASPGPTLDGTEWVSVAVTEDGSDRPLVDGTQIRLGFVDGQLSASAGCNTMGGGYRIDGDTLVFEGGAMTEMGCDDDRHAQDDWLVALLGSGPTIVRDDDKLTLTAGATVITLQDREVAEPDLPLVGTTWTVETVLLDDAAAPVPEDGVATLVFTEDGRIEVESGCNAGNGSYEATDRTVVVTELFMNLGLCQGARADLEQSVTNVVKVGVLPYSIDGDALRLVAGDAGLVLRGN